jgi:hypothetical protein
MGTQNLDDLQVRREAVAQEAVERGLWCESTGKEFVRLHHTDEDLQFWEEALLSLVSGDVGERPPAG